MGTSEWLALFNSVVTLIAAVVAAAVAYVIGTGQADIARQQAAAADREAKTSHNKLKLDLFERRSKVYEAVKEIVAEAIHIGDFGAEAQTKYLLAIRGSRWIFDKTMDTYLSSELWGVLNDVHSTYWTSKELSARSADVELTAKRNAATSAMTNQFLALEGKFDRFMQLES